MSESRTRSTSKRLEKSTTDRFKIVTLAALRGFFAGPGRWLAGPASRLAERLFRTPARYPTPRRERRWLEGAERLRFRYGERELAGWRWGASDEAPTVLLVHGWSGRGSQLGAFVEPLVAAGFSVVAYDAPAHGESPGNRSSLPEVGEAVLAVARQVTGEGGRLAGVVAHSVGAGGTIFALGRGLEVERLAFVAPGLDVRDFTAAFGRALSVPRRVIERLGRRLERRFGFAMAELASIEVLARLDPARVPKLWIAHDRLDEETPCWRSRDLVRAWPGAHLEVTSGLGHRRILRDPRVVEGVVGFLEPARREVAAPVELNSSPMLPARCALPEAPAG